MAATIDAMNLYRDPILDGALPQPSQTYQNSQPVRRTVEQDLRPSQDYHGAQAYTNPDALVGPTTSYRGVGPNPNPGIHRSFSQRARGRPYAEEAFSDERDNGHSVNKTRRTTERSVSAEQPTPAAHPIHPAEQGRSTAKKTRRTSYSISQVTYSDASRNQNSDANEQVPIGSPSTLKDAGKQTEEQRRNWAPDRSPLQKLEVKLTDISKEEKRARVQEAESRLRQSQGSSATPRQRDTTPRAVSQPVSSPSRTKMAAMQPSIHDTDQNMTPRMNDGMVAKDRTKGERISRQIPTVDIPVRQHGAAGQQRRSTSGQQQLDHSQRPLNLPLVPFANGGQIPAAHPRIANVPNAGAMRSQIPRSVSKSQRPPQEVSRATDMPLTAPERQMSHQAALQQLTGQPTSFTPQRGLSQGSRKPQSRGQTFSNTGRPLGVEGSPVAVDLGTLAGEPLSFTRSNPNTLPQSKAQATQPPSAQRSQPVIGLGVQSPPVSRSINSQPSDYMDPSKNRQRKSSVSFKEPFDTRRPVDEWKTAQTARLTLDDFDTKNEQAKSPEVYKAWWEQNQTPKGGGAKTAKTQTASSAYIDDRRATFTPPLHLKCGPLLRYVGLGKRRVGSDSTAVTKEYWRGSVMIVTQDSQCSYTEVPSLRLFSQPKKLLPPPPALVTGDQLAPEYVDPIAGLTKLSRTGSALYVRPVDHLEEAKDLSRLEDDTGIYEASPSPLDVNGSKSATAAANNRRTLDIDGERLGRYKEVKGARIYADPDRDVTFWRFNIEVELGPDQQHIAYRINRGAAIGFWVPAQGKSMNIMFHSCNGFSMSVDADTFSGPDPLWRDVLNNHQTRPFHVMIGGGDQIYNDRVMADTQLFGEWTRIRNPHHKHHAPFTPEMRNELETFYLGRYSMWFSQGLFGMANASIPMINIWDDHDIIDGFGSYPDDFMKSPVFCGLGEIAHKYYLLFQHQTVDNITERDEPSWLLGKKPGPYIQHLSRSIYLELGQSVAFLGLDCRTERTRDEIMSIDTLEMVLDRCRREMTEGKTKHLIVLLGVPIAYPRLVWLENVLTSRALDPIKALHRAGIVKTKLLNRFDGGVEILDDLDDHWTASNHKQERNIFIQDLQDLAAEKSARITILSGDVHLAAVGQFYSNPKLKVPKDRDHRYMPNIISSAIVNTPPPDMLADVLNKRNKVHHLDKYTDENMIPVFTHDVDDKKRNNNCLLPRRNWCSIREYTPGETPPPSPPSSPSIPDDDVSDPSDIEQQHLDDSSQNPKRRMSFTKNGFNPRNLMRRFSSRGAPPNSFRTGGDGDQIDQRAASLNDVQQTQSFAGQHLQTRTMSADHIPDVPALRPTFHRRPTNLAEKAARKGIVPMVDAEGKEVHFNDHINLEGGLDIVLNCEVNQKDPAGITTQYRLLVPALWYDGSSDREKIGAAYPSTKGNTLLRKFGLNSRKSGQYADAQGAVNQGQDMSETESYTESEDDAHEAPKKRFSLFGGMRKKQLQQASARNEQGYQPPAASVEQTGREVMPPRDLEHSGLHPIAGQQSNTHRFNDTRAVSQSVHDPRPSQNVYSSTQPAVQQQYQQQPSGGSLRQSDSQKRSRPLSYIIGGGGPQIPQRPGYATSQPPDQPLYDPDAAYVSSQQQNNSAGIQRSVSLGQNAPYRADGRNSFDKGSPQLQPGTLRGNGIIGKNIPPTSYRGNNVGIHYGGAQHEHEQEPKGYSGIEAYKTPKPKRRWSLRDRARNIMGSFEGKRRGNEDSWYSDEEEEAYWEDNRRW